MITTAALLMGVTLIAASLLRPKKPSKAKLETYECGMETVGDTWVQFRVQYYVLALVFVVFDIEAVFIYPWAVKFKDLGWTGLISMFGFLFAVVVALVYVWRKGALEWEK